MTARRGGRATVSGVVGAALAATALVAAPHGLARAARSEPRFSFCRAATPFSAGSFPTRPRSTNAWLPLTPGLRTVVSGTVRGDDGELHPHSTTMRVSDAVKRVAGVAARVVFEQDWEDGELQESELTLAAEDLRGNVWLLGEYPEEWSGGKPEGAPDTWVAPLQHARPGLVMRAHPRTGSAGYAQGFAPSVGFRDCAKVTGTRKRTCTRLMCFGDVLVTREWSPLDPEGGFQFKSYVRGIGAVKVGALGGNNAEVLSLRAAARMLPNARRALDRAVLAQDRRGYTLSPRVWGHTAHARCTSALC